MLAKDLQSCFIEKKETLAGAESCTGGRVSATLVEVPDASLYFLGSIVSYANSAKHKLLGVKAQHAVSEECALEMAEGAKEAFGSTIAFATTGVAGPSGEPIGKVCFAIALPGKTLAWTEHFEGDRQQIIDQTTKRILERLYDVYTAR